MVELIATNTLIAQHIVLASDTDILRCCSSWFPLDWRTHLQHRVKV